MNKHDEDIDDYTTFQFVKFKVHVQYIIGKVTSKMHA